MILEHSMNGAWPRTINSDSKQSCSYVPLTLYKKAEDPQLLKYHWKWLTSFGICYKTEDTKFWGIVALHCYQGLDEKNNEGFFVWFCLGKAHLNLLFSSSLYWLSLSFISCACHINQSSVVSVIQWVLRLVIPIHGAFHGFDPVFHIHFIFLPFLLWLENHFTLPQFL